MPLQPQYSSFRSVWCPDAAETRNLYEERHLAGPVVMLQKMVCKPDE